jgi:hypothetical protein
MSGDSEVESLKLEVTGSSAVKALDDINKLVQDNREKVRRIYIEVDSNGAMDNSIIEVNVNDLGSVEISTPTITFKSGSTASKLANCIDNLDNEWSNSGEIRRCAEKGSDIDMDALSQTLWDLSERGLLDKRDCESDGRMKEYRLSEKGKESLAELNGN